MATTAAPPLSLTSAQFHRAWVAGGGQAMPYPLEHRPATTLESDRDRENHGVEEWAAMAEPAVFRAVERLVQPQLIVTVHVPGTGSIRRFAAVAGRTCLVADQQTGGAGTGDIVLYQGTSANGPDVDDFAFSVLSAVPDNVAGRAKAVSADRSELSQTPRSAADYLVSVAESDVELVRRLTSARTNPGYVTIRQSEPGTAGQIVDSLTWFDVPGDGRYLFFEDHRLNLRGVEMSGVVAFLASRVGRHLRQDR